MRLFIALTFVLFMNSISFADGGDNLITAYQCTYPVAMDISYSSSTTTAVCLPDLGSTSSIMKDGHTFCYVETIPSRTCDGVSYPGFSRETMCYNYWRMRFLTGSGGPHNASANSQLTIGVSSERIPQGIIIRPDNTSNIDYSLVSINGVAFEDGAWRIPVSDRTITLVPQSSGYAYVPVSSVMADFADPEPLIETFSADKDKFGSSAESVGKKWVATV